jgi:hypothetical protein
MGVAMGLSNLAEEPFASELLRTMLADTHPLVQEIAAAALMEEEEFWDWAHRRPRIKSP